MDIFEYLKSTFKSNENVSYYLNECGSKGWEAFSVISTSNGDIQVFFKRKIKYRIEEDRTIREFLDDADKFLDDYKKAINNYKKLQEEYPTLMNDLLEYWKKKEDNNEEK